MYNRLMFIIITTPSQKNHQPTTIDLPALLLSFQSYRAKGSPRKPSALITIKPIHTLSSRHRMLVLYQPKRMQMMLTTKQVAGMQYSYLPTRITATRPIR